MGATDRCGLGALVYFKYGFDGISDVTLELLLSSIMLTDSLPDDAVDDMLILRELGWTLLLAADRGRLIVMILA